MDYKVVFDAIGVIAVSLAGWLTARKAKNAGKQVMEEGNEEINSKLDILLRSNERIDHRLIRTETALNEHIEWHLKERIDRHG